MSDPTVAKDRPRRVAGPPARCFSEWQPGGDGVLVADFELPQYWLERAAPLSLTALYCMEGGRLRLSVTDQPLPPGDLPATAQYRAWVDALSLSVVDTASPQRLGPCHIPKPWGQEIWFSGVEERGVCTFLGDGLPLPLPWLQAAWPEAALGTPGKPLILLKILDPSPQEVRGDLYFELHQEKREVYVVTHVDPDAWPSGTGYIRYGFDPERIAEFASEQAFREAYLAAVKAYEKVRRALDAGEGGPELVASERRLRADMERFTHLRPLTVGDVVKVPLRLPHSLQHGVRTIEFQTPVYERQILSFAQQVLTQDHWDTERAVREMELLPPTEDDFELLLDAPECRVERIVDFSDFEVRRIAIRQPSEKPLADLPDYGMVMVVSGELALGDVVLGPEQAAVLPRGWRRGLGPAGGCEDVVFLLALPRGGGA